jgi:hypothetical protein
MKKPADKGLESVATIFPSKFTIFNDFITLIPAGPEAPGIRTVDSIVLGIGHDHLLL